MQQKQLNLRFTKMQGLGNDFVVIYGKAPEPNLSDDWIRFIANRRFGIGCDQVLYVGELAENSDSFTYRIFNSDGSVAQQCGNGARCVAKYLFRKFPNLEKVKLLSPNGIIVASLTPERVVKVEMGKAFLEPREIPFLKNHYEVNQTTPYSYELKSCRGINFVPVGVGNPHAVVFFDEIPDSWVDIARKLGEHKAFPQGVNVEICCIKEGKIYSKIYERGAGVTLACGSGACAVAVASRLMKLTTSHVEVVMPGGSLLVEVDENLNMTQIGAAQFVFEGII